MSWRTTPEWNRKGFSFLLFEKSRWFKSFVHRWCEEPVCLVSPDQLKKIPNCLLRHWDSRSPVPTRTNTYRRGKTVLSWQQWDKTVLSPVLSRGQKSHLRFCSRDKNHTFFLVALLPRSARRCSCWTAVVDRCRLRQSFCRCRGECRWQRWRQQQSEWAIAPRAGTDANGGGRQQPDDCLAWGLAVLSFESDWY